MTDLESENAQLRERLAQLQHKWDTRKRHAGEVHALFHEATKDSQWQIAMHGPDEVDPPALMRRVIGAWEASKAALAALDREAKP